MPNVKAILSCKKYMTLILSTVIQVLNLYEVVKQNKNNHIDRSNPDTPPLAHTSPPPLFFPYPWRILLHLVLVAMGTTGMPPPEAVLTELVIMTLLAAVAEAHHTLSMAVGALDRVKDCREERRGHTQKHACTQMHKQMWQTIKPYIVHIAVRTGLISINLRRNVIYWQCFCQFKQMYTRQCSRS